MQLRIITAVLLTLYGGLLFSQTPKPASGKIVRYSEFASQWIPSRTVDIWLPEGYTPSKKYAVLYMHDGQMLYDSASTWNHQEWKVDETIQELIKQKKIKECIVVGIWNAGIRRHAEYFPQAPYEMLTKAQQEKMYNSYRGNGQSIFSGIPISSDLYLKFITQELKPFVDSHYSTRPERDYTAICGSSMGGLISLYAICEYPEVFGSAACLSTHWPGVFSIQNNPIPAAFFAYLQKKLPEPASHRIYFDYGTETLDSMYATLQLQVDQIMKRKGFTAENWVSLSWPGQDHSEKSWSSRLAVPMEFILHRLD